VCPTPLPASWDISFEHGVLFIYQQLNCWSAVLFTVPLLIL
jgi:hypothetical protein